MPFLYLTVIVLILSELRFIIIVTAMQVINILVSRCVTNLLCKHDQFALIKRCGQLENELNWCNVFINAGHVFIYLYVYASCDLEICGWST